MKTKSMPIAMYRVCPVNMKQGRTTFSVTLNHPTQPGKRLKLESHEDHYDGGGWTIVHDVDDARKVVEFIRTRSAQYPISSIEDCKYSPNMGAAAELALCQVVEIPPDRRVQLVDPETGRPSSGRVVLEDTIEARMTYLRQYAAISEVKMPFNRRLQNHDMGSRHSPNGVRVFELKKDRPTQGQRLGETLEMIRDTIDGTKSSVSDDQLALILARLNRLEGVEEQNAALRTENDSLKMSGRSAEVKDSMNEGKSALMDVGNTRPRRTSKKKVAVVRRNKRTAGKKNTVVHDGLGASTE